MEWFLIYLFVMIERIGNAFALGWVAFFIGIGLGVIMFIAVGIDMMETNQHRRRENELTFKEIWESNTFIPHIRKISKPLIIVGLILGSIGHFTPTQKDLAIIVGAGVTYKILTSPEAKEIGGKSMELLSQKITDALNTP